MKGKVLKLRQITPPSIKITRRRTTEGSLRKKERNTNTIHSQRPFWASRPSRDAELTLFPFGIDSGLHFVPGPQWASNCENDSIYKIHLIKEVNWALEMKGRTEVERVTNTTKSQKHTWIEEKKKKKNQSKRDGGMQYIWNLRQKWRAFNVFEFNALRVDIHQLVLTRQSNWSLSITDPWNDFLCWCSD